MEVMTHPEIGARPDSRVVRSNGRQLCLCTWGPRLDQCVPSLTRHTITKEPHIPTVQLRSVGPER